MILETIRWSMLIVTGLSAFSISVSALADSCGRLCDPVWVHSAMVDDVRNELDASQAKGMLHATGKRFPDVDEFNNAGASNDS